MKVALTTTKRGPTQLSKTTAGPAAALARGETGSQPLQASIHQESSVRRQASAPASLKAAEGYRETNEADPSRTSTWPDNGLAPDTQASKASLHPHHCTNPSKGDVDTPDCSAPPLEVAADAPHSPGSHMVQQQLLVTGEHTPNTSPAITPAGSPFRQGT